MISSKYLSKSVHLNSQSQERFAVTSRIHQDDHRFMLFDAVDIRDGLGDTNAGWVMGSFISADDLRQCEDFEIKEWDLRTMRKDWRNGEECGTEYIAVLDGVLTVLLGRVGKDGKSIEDDRMIEVGTDQRILLARGVWRKLKGTHNVKGLTVRKCAG
jgi:hypothetical protein